MGPGKYSAEKVVDRVVDERVQDRLAQHLPQGNNLSGREDARIWDRSRALYRRVYFSLRMQE